MTATKAAGEDQDLEDRVREVLATMDIEARRSLALGDMAPLVERHLPALSYVDAGTGLRDVAGATAFPAGICLAAAFDADLGYQYGRAIGAEVRASGHTVLLGPTLDLARDPRAGRIPEGFGEDPYLTGLIGAAHVRGVQSCHVIAQLKHYLAYNTDSRRTGHGPPQDRGDAVDVRASWATLHDVYLRPFRAAVAAGAWSIMGSYNRVNGQYVCQSRTLLDLPRTRWGWRGFYCPDAVLAVRDDAAAFAAGLDLPALGGSAGRTTEVLDDIDPTGRLVDATVANVVRALIGSGLADDPLPAPSPPSTPDHRRLARRTAVAGSVLLLNRRGVLPLALDVRSLALIGPSGTDAMYVGGGAAAVTLDQGRLVTPHDGIIARAGTTFDVLVSQGSLGDVPMPLVPSAAYTLPDRSGPGVLVEWAGPTGGTAATVEPRIDHGTTQIDPQQPWPRRWTTRLTSRVEGPHRLSLELGGRAMVRVDGRVVMAGARELEQFFGGPHLPLQATVDLAAGQAVDLEIEYEIGPAIAIPPAGRGPTLRLGWQPPDTLIADAVEAAAKADVAVVLVNAASGEGMDRDTLALPGDQDELVARVAAANSRTVVVLNTPGAVQMPWADDVAGILQVWYPGEQFGTALAAILFGDDEPGGRLPLTFPQSPDDLPGGDRATGEQPPSIDYAEGPAIGYRSQRLQSATPLFPFGAGQGYARTAHAVTDAAVHEGQVRLEVRATNQDPRATTHVAQVYAQLDGEDSLELCTVSRIAVGPQGTATGLVVIGPDAFARWDDAAQRHTPRDGDHLLHVRTASDSSGPVIQVRVSAGVVTQARRRA